MTPPDRLAPLAALLLAASVAAAGCGPARPTESPPIARGTALPPPGLAMPAASR
jgi:hypothetical protein